ncbi:MAG TPA: hypothetical protein ENK78_02845 [Thiothrix sp.]|nr:hypothetical protein [Thiothrix sp.]
MRKKSLPLNCQAQAPSELSSKTLGQLLAEVLQHYAYAAYPVGGSECAQASREAVLTLANHFADCDTVLELRPRQRPILKNAIQWYYTDYQPNPLLASWLLQQFS